MPLVERRKITARSSERKRQPERLTREEHIIEGLSPLLNLMIKAVRKASRGILRDFGEVTNLQISSKTPGDFVSNTDTYVEKILKETLLEVYPDYGVYCEESGHIEPKNGSDCVWIIDPIDGTINFIHAIPYFAISVALLKGDDIVASVVYNPVSNEMYYAEKGKGAFALMPTGVVRLRASGRKKMDTALIGSNALSDPKSFGLISKVLNHVSSVRYTGSIALGLVEVAAGKFEGYITAQFNVWDIAAGMLLVKEAGGSVTSLGGDKILVDILENKTLVVSNIHLKEKILSLLK